MVDVSDFDSDAAKLGGSSPSSVAIMPHIPSYGGEEGREGGVWDRAHKSLLIKAVTSVRRKIATFCEFFVGKKNKTRILCTFSITVIILVSKTMGSEFES